MIMNLSGRQIKALAQELYRKIRPLQEEQLNKIRDKVEKDVIKSIEKKYPILVQLFNTIDWNTDLVSGLTLSRKISKELLGRDYAYNVKDMKEVISLATSTELRVAFEKKYGQELNMEALERMLVLETIEAKNVSEITASIMKKLKL